jgi:glycosyltransferase involved in cell wall biosynthesis
VTSSSSPPLLSVIIPVFNGEGWIGRCLQHLETAVMEADIGAEVILVDDGSTDGTVAEATSALGDGPVELHLISQANEGRFAARRKGLDAALADTVLFIDTRVFIDRGALAFVMPQVGNPATSVWTSHVAAATEGNPIAGFWQAIEHVAWRRYFKQPRTMSYGIAEFDFYPKGTTALIAPREMLIDAFDAYDPTVDDWHKVNDDTAVLRWVAERVPINISPDYRSTYNARTTLKAFMKHAEHRGTVLIDGYLRPGARFAEAIAVVLAVTPVALWFLIRHPVRALLAAAAGSAGAAVASERFGAQRHDALVLGRYAVPFGVAYLVGMWRGVALRVLSWRRRRAG